MGKKYHFYITLNTANPKSFYTRLLVFSSGMFAIDWACSTHNLVIAKRIVIQQVLYTDLFDLYTT